MQIRKSMMFQERKQSIFQCPIWVTVFALIAAIVWGWAYPLIKIGFREFQITTSMTGSKMLFAGVRFFYFRIDNPRYSTTIASLFFC